MKLVVLSAFAIAIAALPAWGAPAPSTLTLGVGNGPNGKPADDNYNVYSGQYTFIQSDVKAGEDPGKAFCFTYAHSHQDFLNAQTKFGELFNVDCRRIDENFNTCTSGKGVKLDWATLDKGLRGIKWGYCHSAGGFGVLNGR